MSSLSQKTRYTNHSLQATSIHVVDNIGDFAGKFIMTLTGHKSEGSLNKSRCLTQFRTHCRETSYSSNKNGKYTETDNIEQKAKKSCDTVRGPVYTFVSFELIPLSDSQFDNLVEDLAKGEFHDDEFDNILSFFFCNSHLENQEKYPCY